MNRFLYDVGIKCYHAAIRFYAYFNIKAKKWIDGRVQLFASLQTQHFHDTIWFHCASVGEFEQGYPLLKLLKKQYPQSTFLVTFFSASGYEYTKKRHNDFVISYLPLDTKTNAETFMDIVQPKVAFFIKYEFWYHFLNTLHTRQIPTYLISGIFRKNQLFFRSSGSFHRSMLRCFTYLFVQNNESKALLETIQITNAGVFGDTRYDRVTELKHTDFNDPIIEQFIDNHPVFIAGSIWNSDDEALKKIMQFLPSNWKIILAPHEMDAWLPNWIKEPYCLYSDLHPCDTRILVIDMMGLLSRLYRKANLVYIGGGFGKGIHNMLEAAVYEVPLMIGPNYQKFNEAKELIEAGLAFDISVEGSEQKMLQLLTNESMMKNFKTKFSHFMQDKSNVSEKICVFLNGSKHLS